MDIQSIDESDFEDEDLFGSGLDDEAQDDSIYGEEFSDEDLFGSELNDDTQQESLYGEFVEEVDRDDDFSFADNPVDDNESSIIEQNQTTSEEYRDIETPDFIASFGYYQADGIPVSTIDRLSKARFSKLNLELMESSDVRISTISDEIMLELIHASLGNAELNKSPMSKMTLTSKFTKMLMDENFSVHTIKKNLKYKDDFFTDFANIKNPTEHQIVFKKYVKTAEKTESQDTIKAITCLDEFALPNHMLSVSATAKIKKLFAFELLYEELTNRMSIQNKLSVTIDKYEYAILNLYKKVTNVKSMMSSSSGGSEIVVKKIALMHEALKQEGLIDLALNRVKEKGSIEINYTKKQLRSILNKVNSVPPTIAENKIDVLGMLFNEWDKAGFAIKTHSIDDFDKEINKRIKILDEQSKSGDHNSRQGF